jgi:hypothetical protein
VIYPCLSILALTENDVLNGAIVTYAICQAHAVSLLYMQIVWYWAGYHEKETHHPAGQPSLEILYETKEMRLALFLAVLSIAGLSLAQTLGPFDYMSDQGDITMRIAPCAFLLLAVTGTIWIQDNILLDDEYGKEQYGKETNLSSKEGIIKNATRITGGKLAVSILLIVFGFLVESNVIGEYFRGLRAYTAKIPDRAWQFDTANRYTIGTGFLPSPTLYL